MGMWDRAVSASSKVFSPFIQRKAAVSAPINGTLINPYMGLLLAQEITPYQAWLLYMNVAPFAKIVDLIADETARLVPLVKVNGKPVDGHPLSQFMRRPGFNRSRQGLIKELAVQYLVTGNAYMHSIGEVSRPPIALDVLKSVTVAPTIGSDMWPEQFLFAEGTRSIRFQRDPNESRDFRWIDASMGIGEIHSIYDMDGTRRGVGISRLNSIRHDVDMRLKGIIHNSATLENGARMSGVLSVKGGLTTEQANGLRKQIETLISGATNAGRILITSGDDLTFTQMSQNMKDMDFANLIRLVEDAIVSRYNVPVSLFRTEAQTNNNYEVAWRQLYFTSVLPCFEVIWAHIANAMSLRLQEDIEIEHDSLTNPILAKYATDRAVQLFQARLISRNEGRGMVGFEPALGGDTIYGPMGEVPVGEDFFTGIDDANNRLTADQYQEQRTGALPPERQPPPKDDEKPAKKPAAKPQGKAWGDLRVVH